MITCVTRELWLPVLLENNDYLLLENYDYLLLENYDYLCY